MLATTVFSSPAREAGITGGSSRYRGNHPPTLSRDLFDWLKPRLVIDPMCGSNTTGDVCQAMGIKHWTNDLRLGFNILTDEIPTLGDLVFSHDPYHDIIQYSGNVWGSQPHPDDLSRCANYEEFLGKIDQAHYRMYQALRSGGYLVIMTGDVKRKGALYPLQRDIRWYGNPIQMLIKIQHNVWSNGVNYGGLRDPRIMHEYVIVTQKPKQFASAWLVGVRRTELVNVDQRTVSGQTWNGIVWTALFNLGGEATLSVLYTEIGKHARARNAEAQAIDWRAIVRRTLQETCSARDRGVWALPA